MRKEVQPRKDPLMGHFSNAPRQAPCARSAVSTGWRSKTVVLMFKPPFAWREFNPASVGSSRRVSIVADTDVDGSLQPFLLTFTFNILLTEFGAADFSGTGAALGTVRQIRADRDGFWWSRAPALTAMCADLGAADDSRGARCAACYGRQSYSGHLWFLAYWPRPWCRWRWAATVILVGLAGAYFFCVYIQHVSPGAFAAGLTLIIGSLDVTQSR